MSDTCICRIHPDGFNGDLPRMGQFSSWVPCPEPVVMTLRMQSLGRHFPVCKNHAQMVAENLMPFKEDA